MIKILRTSYFLVFSIILISFITLFPSFSLALFGDDWLAFFRYRQHVDPGSGQWNHLTYYLTPYGPQDILMGLLYKIYGFNSTLYYLTSYFLRMFAAFSLYPLVFYLTKNRLSAFFAALFFALTAIGLDTTNWVFNMPTYVTISLFFLSLYYFLYAREEKAKSKLPIAALLYYLSYITAPVRMHGSLIFLFFLEFFWFFQNRDKKTFKSALIRFSVMFLVFLIVRFAGQSQGPPNEAGERFLMGITAGLGLLEQGRFDFIFYPIVMLGGMILPDLLINNSVVTSYKQILFSIIPIFLGSLIFISLLLKFTEETKTLFNKNLTLALAFWTLVTILTAKGNIATFGNTIHINLVLIGGYFLVFVIFLLISRFKQKNISSLLFLSLSWTILSFIFAWWWVPNSIFPTTYRYLIVSGAGIAILLASLISLPKKQAHQLILLALLLPLILINIVSARIYLNQLQMSHNQEISNKIWSSIPNVAEIYTSKEPFIFYFEGDGTNGGTLHDVITFGFPPHMGLIYDKRQDDGLPVPISNPQELISTVIDGKNMPAYGYKARPIDVDRIYAFHLQGSDSLINITELAREKLKQIKKDQGVK